VTPGWVALSVLAASSVQWLGPPPPVSVERVVTLAPSLTEAVLALDAGTTLVAVSRFDEAPQVAGLPRVGGFSDLSVEAVLAVHPQLVVVQKAPGNQRPVETLASLGVSVLALPLTSVEDVAVALAELGRALGRPTEGARLVEALAQVRRRVREEGSHWARHPRVLLVYGFSPLVVAGPGSFAHQLLEDCGAVNAAERAPTAYPSYSLERLVALAPEVLVDASDSETGRDAVRALPPLKRTRWVELPNRDLLHPGPSLATALPGLCALLAPPASGPPRH
jgi:iron complex transport system substrate-binding protein